VDAGEEEVGGCLAAAAVAAEAGGSGQTGSTGTGAVPPEPFHNEAGLSLGLDMMVGGNVIHEYEG